MKKKILDKLPVTEENSGKKSLYNPEEFEQKWQKYWEIKGIYSPDLDKSQKPFYNLMMFPYPSAEGMHVGNMYAFTGSDIYGRYMRMKGYDVFEPIGLDGFGIHSENYAIKVGRHPKEQAERSEANFYRQLRAIGNSFDWSRSLETYDPEYYKWTQWIFIQLYNAGLVYRKKAPVNFCPSDKTVLADEQVIDGKCERCGSTVEKRDLEQWFFKITAYADRLLEDLSKIDWSEKVKIAQRNWIGKSTGAEVKFKIKDSNQEIFVFTTRVDTIFGVTFIALSPEHPFVKSLLKDLHGDVEQKNKIKAYVDRIKAKENQEKDKDKEKNGLFSGSFCISPVDGKEIPIWISDYVLMEYGTGAIMGVPAHDVRDYEFATKHKIAITSVIKKLDKPANTPEGKDFYVYTEPGILINSGEFNGVTTEKAQELIIRKYSKQGIKKTTSYHLRDWLISRQRYWGPPIPLIHCEKCGWQTVPEEDLPVLLPIVDDWKPKGSGESPLATIDTFVNTICPKCHGNAKRETDVSDTFLDSAWYFLRYTSTEESKTAWIKERVKKWLPVNMYIGGAEHSVLHLLYTRFITKVFYDIGLVSFDEPFPRFFAHGLLIKEGSKMSKSKGNVIIPDEYVRKYGADTLRTYLMFIGPFNAGGDFYDTGIEGIYKFLKRIWVLLNVTIDSHPEEALSQERNMMLNQAIARVTEAIETFRYNVAIAAVMEYYNFLNKQEAITIYEKEVMLKLLAPFAPFMTEELYQKIWRSSDNKENGSFESIHKQSWPVSDNSLIIRSQMQIAIQINGKTRQICLVDREVIGEQQKIEQIAYSSDKIKKYIEGKDIKKIIYIKGKIINFVI